MIKEFRLGDFGVFAGNFERACSFVDMLLEPPPVDASREDLLRLAIPEYEKALEGLLRAAPAVPLSYPVSRQIELFVQRLRDVQRGSDHSAVVEHAKAVRQMLMDDFAQHLFLSVDAHNAAWYQEPLGEWEKVIDRFGCSFDIEEGRKCFALGRYTASVFHIMKALEAAVIELQDFLGRERDPKAHFGSVVSKLEIMLQKGTREHVPEHLRDSLQFLGEVLTQLHAVKDSWRNKVAHVDERIIPIDTFTEELTKGVHDATLLLMNKLAAGLPAKPTA